MVFSYEGVVCMYCSTKCFMFGVARGVEGIVSRCTTP